MKIYSKRFHVHVNCNHIDTLMAVSNEIEWNGNEMRGKKATKICYRRPNLITMQSSNECLPCRKNKNRAYVLLCVTLCQMKSTRTNMNK